MAESAIRVARRAATARRITLCAQELADEHGLDGFTMDDLAMAAEVSRRTLFNYFASKTDAVLGTHEPDPAALATFRAGGPHGVLTDDMTVLVSSILEDKAIARDEAARVRRLFQTSPRLLAAAHDHMDRLCERFAVEIIEREGGAFDPVHARILLRVLLAIFDAALDTYIVSADDRTLSELFAEHVTVLQRLLA